MKSIAEITLVGLIFTFSIVTSTIIVPTIVKMTIDKETAFTYSYEKAQHALLTLFSSTEIEGIGFLTTVKYPYEILSQKILFENYTCTTTADCPKGYECDNRYNPNVKNCIGPTTEQLKVRLDRSAGRDYCITTEEITSPDMITGQSIGPLPGPSSEILKGLCASNIVQFKTLITLPYNKDFLIKIVNIGTTQLVD